MAMSYPIYSKSQNRRQHFLSISVQFKMIVDKCAKSNPYTPAEAPTPYTVGDMTVISNEPPTTDAI